MRTRIIGSNAGVLKFKNGLQSKAEFRGAEAAKLWFKLNPDASPEEHGRDPITFEYVEDEGEEE